MILFWRIENDIGRGIVQIAVGSTPGCQGIDDHRPGNGNPLAVRRRIDSAAKSLPLLHSDTPGTLRTFLRINPAFAHGLLPRATFQTSWSESLVV
jgi:hypothetical protein